MSKVYAKIVDGEIVAYPYSEYEIRRDNPSVSFPFPLTKEAAAFANAFEVLPTQKPSDPLKKYVEGDPVSDLGSWRQSWIEVELTEEEVSEIVEAQWEKVRYIRDQKLQETDQTQLPDRPISEELQLAYANYRQELRDITHQADPFNIEWPEAPE